MHARRTLVSRLPKHDEVSVVGMSVIIHPWPKPQHAGNNDHPTNCNQCLKHDSPPHSQL